MKVKFVKKIVKLIIIEFPEGLGVPTNIPSRKKGKRVLAPTMVLIVLRTLGGSLLP